jgi:hypothetical protein
MAKITRYTKDTIGQQLLSIAAVVLIAWCAIAGLNVSDPPGDAPQPPVVEQVEEEGGSSPIWYYLGIPVVSIMWGLANYERTPNAYGSRRMAAIISLMTGGAMGFTVWLFVFASRNPELLSELLLGR